MNEAGFEDGPLHLLYAWNLSYAGDAMDQHLAVLLDWAERGDRDDIGEVYVWWGKLRSLRREDGVGWFEDMELLTGGRRWADRESNLWGESDRMARELPDNLLGERVWNALKLATRTLVAPPRRCFGGVGTTSTSTFPGRPWSTRRRSRRSLGR